MVIKNKLQKDILYLLFSVGDLKRSEIVEELKRPRSTIYDNLEKLRKQGKVENYKKGNGKVGRPYVYWRIRK